MNTGKLLFITSEFPPDPGGIGTYVYESARWLHHFGWQVLVIAKQGFVQDEAAVRSFNDQQPFEIVTTKRLSRVLLRHQVRTFRPDFIISSDLTSAWLCWQVSLLTRTPLIAIAIGSEFRRSSFLRYHLKRLIYSTCLHVVSISQFTLNLMHEVGIRPRGVSIIYPGGDASLNRPGVDAAFLRERYRLDGKRIVLTMGSLSRRKGQDIVISAMPRVLKHYPDVHYLVVGNDRTKGDFQKLVDDLNLQGSVTLTGMITEEEKVAFYNLVEFCMITSRNLRQEVEGFGIVVLEAALCGKTSIGTHGTGVQETMIDGETGLLISQDDPQAAAEAMIRLLDDTPLRHKLETNAYHYASQHGTWEARIREFHELLQRLIANV
jgi:phosphatidyl-myo-inositol dimannoside synthase